MRATKRNLENHKETREIKNRKKIRIGKKERKKDGINMKTKKKKKKKAETLKKNRWKNK